MPREGFLYLRKYERMIEKITPPTPIHLLDHIIIPINIRQIWKFFRMVWTTHVSAGAPGPYWAIPPDRFIRLHPRLTNLTPTMTQTLRNCQQITISSILEVTNDHIRTRWNRRGIRPELAGT